MNKAQMTGKDLSHWMIENNMEIDQFAASLGVAKNVISRWIYKNSAVPAFIENAVSGAQVFHSGFGPSPTKPRRYRRKGSLMATPQEKAEIRSQYRGVAKAKGFWDGTLWSAKDQLVRDLT